MIIAYGAALFCLILIALNLVGIGVAMTRAKPRRAAVPAPKDGPSVSIVRPCCGIDNFCEATLGSSFHLDYPNYEVIFCVARANDPVVGVIQRLIATNPKVAARLIIGDEQVSANPKLNNCVRGWDAARSEWIILADSNVLMPQDYIQRLFARWGKKTGMVCSMPQGSRPGNLGAELECAFLNTFQARWQYCGEGLGIGFAQGKNMLWRRDILEAAGGIRTLAAEIAEDAASTKVVRNAGFKVNLVDTPFEQPLGKRSVRDVWLRQVRWARMRRKTFPLAFAPEILAGGALPLISGSYAAHLLSWNIPLVALAIAVILYSTETFMAVRNGWYFTWRSPFLFALRDLMLPAVYVDAWLLDDFVWRGNAMTVREEERPST